MMKFLDGLDRDLKQSVLHQLRDIWTYTSTGLEGNTLSLGDTQFLLEEGLTISGKPIKDHQEVLGHARAIELIYGLLNSALSEDDLFNLHRAVQTDLVSDIYKPYGAWKLEPNGSYAVTEEGKQVFIEYALPFHVPALMHQWLAWFNDSVAQLRNPAQNATEENALLIYAKAHMGFVHIHPFWDGNGRLARLLANIPLLVSGLPPLVIARESRRDYLRTLAQYQLGVGQLHQITPIWPDEQALMPFLHFVKSQYQTTLDIVSAARRIQQKRADLA